MKLGFMWDEEKDVREVEVIRDGDNEEGLEKMEGLVERGGCLRVKDGKKDGE